MQRGDALLDGRVGAEQRHQAAGLVADAHGGHALRQVARVQSAQAGQRVEHAGVVLNDSADVVERFATLEPDSDRKV